MTRSEFNLIFKIIGVGMLDDNYYDDDASALCCHSCFGFNTFCEDAVNFWNTSFGRRCTNAAGSCLAFFGCSSAALPGSSVALHLFPRFWFSVFIGSGTLLQQVPTVSVVWL
jgi:hypothetical protein